MRFTRAANGLDGDEWSVAGDLFVVPRDITLIADVQDAPGCMIVVNDKEYLVLEKASGVSARLDEVLRVTGRVPLAPEFAARAGPVGDAPR
jgi:hypothetical protein